MKIIVAINKYAKALTFSVADYGPRGQLVCCCAKVGGSDLKAQPC
jgi:electron transfer flavoprotein alpha subunit